MREGKVVLTVNGVPGEYPAGTLLSAVLPDFGLFSLSCGVYGCRSLGSAGIALPSMYTENPLRVCPLCFSAA